MAHIYTKTTGLRGETVRLDYTSYNEQSQAPRNINLNLIFVHILSISVLVTIRTIPVIRQKFSIEYVSQFM